MKNRIEELKKIRQKRRRREWLAALTNPHLLISVGIAWFLTNGWAYCALGLGSFCAVKWLRNAGAVWLGILWMPGTPEKLITFGIAMFLLKMFFPGDARTLRLLHRKRRLLLTVTKMQLERFCTRLFRRRTAE